MGRLFWGPNSPNRGFEQALEAQKESGEPLGKVLVACGHASRLAIQDALARQSGFAFEPEHGYGTGLRTKLVAVERRPEPQADSVKVTESPTYREALAGETGEAEGALAAATTCVAEEEQPLASVIVTQYVPALLTLMDWVVSLVDHDR